jgi:hypothetical protein
MSIKANGCLYKVFFYDTTSLLSLSRFGAAYKQQGAAVMKNITLVHLSKTDCLAYKNNRIL